MPQPSKPASDAYSMAEWLAVLMSRALAANDGEIGGVGAAATIPMAAIRTESIPSGSA